MKQLKTTMRLALLRSIYSSDSQMSPAITSPPTPVSVVLPEEMGPRMVRMKVHSTENVALFIDKLRSKVPFLPTDYGLSLSLQPISFLPPSKILDHALREKGQKRLAT